MEFGGLMYLLDILFCRHSTYDMFIKDRSTPEHVTEPKS